LQNLRHQQQTALASWSLPYRGKADETRKRQGKKKDMAATQTIEVPHLGGIRAGYAISGNGQIDPSKPTCVLVNAMCMTVALYRHQFEDERLTAGLNLLAIEPLGHGATSCPTEHFTYWDTATMALQVLDKLGVERAYALGTSQGGWMVARMAILAPERV
jgi:microsomal epoxide hydrolase